MARRATLLLCILMLHGCATVTRDCEANFATEGNIITGKKFTTLSILPTVAPATAFKNMYKVLANEGFHIESADEKKGIISVYQNVNLSRKTAPLNAIIESYNAGSKVTLVTVASAGIYAPESGVREKFCTMIDQVKN